LEARFYHMFGRSPAEWARPDPVFMSLSTRSSVWGVPVLLHLYLTLRHLGHAVLFRCPGGLTEAAYSLGYAREVMWPAVCR
jgi:hypothetical protein